METPNTNHLTAADFENIYEPAEDTFLLLDALEADLTYLQQTLQPTVCLEIGAGSGVIITAIAKYFKNAHCLATDINALACAATKSTAQNNHCAVDAINCNLVDMLRHNIVDLLFFNPPYVVTSDEELLSKKFAEQTSTTSANLLQTWAGGQHGRRIIDELLGKLDSILTPKGVFYLLLLQENKPEEIILHLKALKFKAIKFMERHIPGEHLCILKVTRSAN